MEEKEWKLKYAKKGDIITSGQITIIFNKWEEGTTYNFIIAFAGIDVSGGLQITDKHWLISNEARLATESERESIFSKLKESGYKWDAKKKVLVLINN